MLGTRYLVPGWPIILVGPDSLWVLARVAQGTSTLSKRSSSTLYVGPTAIFLVWHSLVQTLVEYQVVVKLQQAVTSCDFQAGHCRGPIMGHLAMALPGTVPGMAGNALSRSSVLGSTTWLPIYSALLHCTDVVVHVFVAVVMLLSLFVFVFVLFLLCFCCHCCFLCNCCCYCFCSFCGFCFCFCCWTVIVVIVVVAASLLSHCCCCGDCCHGIVVVAVAWLMCCCGSFCCYCCCIIRVANYAAQLIFSTLDLYDLPCKILTLQCKILTLQCKILMLQCKILT